MSSPRTGLPIPPLSRLLLSACQGSGLPWAGFPARRRGTALWLLSVAVSLMSRWRPARPSSLRGQWQFSFSLSLLGIAAGPAAPPDGPHEHAWGRGGLRLASLLLAFFGPRSRWAVVVSPSSLLGCHVRAPAPQGLEAFHHRCLEGDRMGSRLGTEACRNRSAARGLHPPWRGLLLMIASACERRVPQLAAVALP